MAGHNDAFDEFVARCYQALVRLGALLTGVGGYMTAPP